MDLIDSAFFDTVHDRHVDGDIKYQNVPGTEHVIPMWIADMDFQAPPAVVDALIATARHGIFGYTDTGREYAGLVTAWYQKRMAWEVKPEWLLQTPGVMFAIAAAICALTEAGDNVLICQPVYYPFAKIVSANHRGLIISELQLTNGRYEMDFEDFEAKIVQNSVKVFLLCSPHNPIGRVWTRTELSEIGRICCKHNVYVISDEIHSDFIFRRYRHTPLAAISEELASRTVICTSPSKTFNLAGLQAANIIIPNTDIRCRIHRICRAAGYSGLSTMAIAATKAAYQYGEPWLNTLLAYLQDNIDILQHACAATGGKLSLIRPEGTYLMWLDCRNLSLSSCEPDTFFLKRAGVRLHNGATFGVGGAGFVRMNIACPKSVLTAALERIRQAL